MLYPGPGTEINGSLILYPAYQVTSVSPFWAAVTPAEKISLGTFGTGTGASLWYLLPKLGAGDSWTAAYLTGYISTSLADAAPQFVSRMTYYHSAGTPISVYGAGLNPGPALAGGAALPPTSVGFLFPDLRANFAQGIAQPVLFDGTQLNGITAWYSPVTATLVQGMNDYQTNGTRGLDPVAGSGGLTADFHVDLIQRDRGGFTSTIYNPVLTLFSLLQYAWIPPSAGGFTVAPESLVLGMFGRGRRA